MATKSRSKHQKDLYAVYKAQNRQAVNRKRKLLKLQKDQPNNKQITSALLTIGYRRNTPKTPKWSHSAIKAAILEKKFKKPGTVVQKVIEHKMFLLSARAHNKGELIWSNS